MKLATFDDNRLGVVDGNEILDVSEVIDGGGNRWPPTQMTWLIADWQEFSPCIQELCKTAPRTPLSSVQLGAPVPMPGHVIAAPANYRKHIGELKSRSVSKGRTANEMGFFLKSPASVVGPGGAIELPRGSMRRFDHEVELAVIIGRKAKNVPRADALDYVFGYAGLVDVTLRIEPGVAEEERSMRKSFDTFTPMGPWAVTADEIPNPQDLMMRLWVNEDLRQEASTADMIVDVRSLIELASSVMTLNPGDVIATGTPQGVSPIEPGDQVRLSIERIGDMEIPVRESRDAPPRSF